MLVTSRSAAEYRAMAGRVRDIPTRELPGTAATLTVESEKPTYQVEACPVTPLTPLASMTGEESVLDILPDIPETEKIPDVQPAPADTLPQAAARTGSSSMAAASSARIRLPMRSPPIRFCAAGRGAL